MTTTEVDEAVAATPITGASVTFRRTDASRPRARTAALTILREELAQPIVDTDLIARLIETDPAATLRLLCRANSGTRPGERLDTVTQAMEVFDRWAVTGLVDELAQDAVPAVPELWQILARALACERLSGDRRGYTVGLLSGMADLHGLQLEPLLEDAGVSGTIRVAVTHRRGLLGAALGALLGYLADDAAATERHGFAPHAVYDAYVEAATTAMTTQAAVGCDSAARTTADATAPFAALPQQRTHSRNARRTRGASVEER